MTIHLETEIVATAYDPKTNICSYTIQRGAKRWTVTIPLEHLDAHKGNKQKRRDHVATVLKSAMDGPHDGDV
jgi:hypothetical protein